MKDILGYAPVLLAMTLGLLGVFYGKTGERNQLNRISYLFIALMIAVAAYGSWDVWNKARVKHASEAAAKVEKARLEDRLAESRRVLELESFDLTRPFSYGIFYLDIGLTNDGEPIILKGFTGPFPTFGRAGMTGEVRLRINEIFDYRYTLSSGPGGSVTLSLPDAPPQILKPDKLDCYQDAAGACVETENGAWWIDLIAPVYTHGVKLASPLTLNKIAARAMDEETYGVMIFRDPKMTKVEYQDAVAGIAALGADLKLYAPMIAKASNECPSAIHLPVTLRIAQRSKPGEVVVDIVPGRGRFSTVECEESPI